MQCPCVSVSCDMRLAEPFTYRETGLAIGVHRRIAGLLESVYELCRSRKLADAGIAFARQLTIPLVYESADAGDAFKADNVAAGELIPEIKAVSSILPIHAGLHRTYLRMSRIQACPLLELQHAASDGSPLAHRGAASVEAGRFSSVVTVFSALPPC